MISIVILSFERHEFLRRQLLTYADRPVHLLLADGSERIWPHGVAGSVGQMTWEYFNVGGYGSYPQRLAEACHRVSTRYVCLLDDQETIFMSGIMSAIAQLETHPQQSCAGGRVASTVQIAGRIRLIPYERWSSHWSLLDADPIARFRAVTSQERTANLYYQVVRTSDMRKFVDGLSTFRSGYSSAIEIYVAGCLALSGKWEMGAYPYWVRNGGSLARPVAEHADLAALDAADIGRRLVASREATSSRPQANQVPDVDRDAMTMQLLAVWGASSLLARRGTTSFGRVRFRRAAERSKKKLAKILRAHAPRVYRRLSDRPEPDLSFADYAMTHAAGSPTVLLDMLRTEGIWQEFPDGLTESDWARLSGEPVPMPALHFET